MLYIIKKAFKGKVKDNNEVAVTKEVLSVNPPRAISNQTNQVSQFPVLTKAPLFVKLDFILKSIDVFYTDPNKKDIDWDLVNIVINSSKSAYDYNINVPKRFTELNHLFLLRSTILMAINNVFPYYRQNCKACGESFDLNYGELNFYQEQELKVPVHCKPCIKARKNN